MDFYFQYFGPDGRKRLYPIGPYDASGVRGFTLAAARDKAAELSLLYRSGTTDLHEHHERLRQDAAQARRATEEAARLELEAARRATLKQLLEAYVAHLEHQGKKSAANVRVIFKRNVFVANPELAARKAADISTEEFVGLLGSLVEAGKGRTGAKLRAYLRAAFAVALRSKTDPSIPISMRAFGITANPIADISAMPQYNRARDRVLNAKELAALVGRLQGLPDGPQKDALLLCLYLGGQRPAQLLRARAVDVDLSAGTITLHDPKGARQQARQHVVPLLGNAADILKLRLARLRGAEPLFSTDGETSMRPETLSKVVADIAQKLVETKEVRDTFQLRDLRRTAETMLAALGVSSDVRAQLQSHGLGGVQQRHYDRHNYMQEKRRALLKWMRHLERLQSRKLAEVVPIMRKMGT